MALLPDPVTLLQVIINGLLAGGIYSLVSIGLTLIYGTLDIVNFAHGEMLMVSMYISYVLFTFMGLDPLLSMPICTFFLFLIGVATQKLLINPVLRAPMQSQIFVTFGLLVFLQNLALTIFSPDYKTISTEYSAIPIRVGPILVSYPKFIAFVITIFLSGLLYLFLQKTDTGRAIRATAQDREAAEALGINTSFIYLLTFGLGAACVGATGALISTYFYIFPRVGTVFSLTAFVVCVLGGMGNYVGAFTGGLIIGIAEAVGGFLIDPKFKQVVSFIIFIVILLFKPEGIFGKALRE